MPSKQQMVAVILALATCISHFADVAHASPRTSAPNTEIGESVEGHPEALDDKVGWYQMEGGTRRLMTWAAGEGLTLNDFATRQRWRLVPRERDVFVMLGADDNETEVIFERDVAGTVRGFRWADASSQQHAAWRIADFGYDQQEILFRNGATQLAGLLLTPLHPGPHPAVVMIHGTGNKDRDDFWALFQADFLARHGIAVLLPDKRGCGKSGGKWQSASFEELARDALAGVSHLKFVDGIDPQRIGMMGLSHGGWIAPLAATLSEDVGFVISISGSAVTPSEQIRHEISSDIRSYGTPDFLVPLIAFALERRSKHKREEWWEKNGSFDAVKYWEKVHCPVLVVYGSNDESESLPVHRSVTRLEEVRNRSGNRDFTIRVFPNTGHEMEAPDTGWIRSEYMMYLTEWLLTRST